MSGMMRLLCVLLVVCTATASPSFDLIQWSSQPLNGTTIDSVMSSASVTSPVVVFAVEGFTMAQFTDKVGAFSSSPTDSPLVILVRSSANHKPLLAHDVTQVRPDALAHTAADTTGKPVVLFKLKSWKDLEVLAPQVSTALADKRAIMVLTSRDAFSTEPIEKRKKRVSVSSDVTFGDEDSVAEKQKPQKTKSNPSSLGAVPSAATALPMPVVLPPMNVTGSGFVPTPNDLCLFYLEGVNIVVMSKSSGKPVYRNLVVDSANGTNTFNWDPLFLSCAVNNQTIGTAKFQISLNVKTEMIAYYEKLPVFSIKPGQTIAFELTFLGSTSHYWYLTEVAMLSTLTISDVTNGVFLNGDFTLKAGSNTTQTRYMGVNSYYQYAFGCSGTQAAFMNADKDYMVGIALNNVEVDLKAYYDKGRKMLVFNRDVNDCVGTFSVGSWMGIISSLVMISVLIFGYLMLQSVQTGDRFDDPKQKQIVINFKE